MVSVTVRRIDGEELNGYSLITVEDYWIAVIGDSYASGEGNPDHSANANKPAQWLSGLLVINENDFVTFYLLSFLVIRIFRLLIISLYHIIVIIY